MRNWESLRTREEVAADLCSAVEDIHALRLAGEPLEAEVGCLHEAVSQVIADMTMSREDPGYCHFQQSVRQRIRRGRG
jgi:hypothetical protein